MGRRQMKHKDYLQSSNISETKFLKDFSKLFIHAFN